MSSACSICDADFKIGANGSLQRRLIASVASPYTARKVFATFSPSSSKYICSECMCVLRSKTLGIKLGGKNSHITKRKWSGPRTPMKDSPNKKQDIKDTPSKLEQELCNCEPNIAKPGANAHYVEPGVINEPHVYHCHTTCDYQASAMRQIAQSHYFEAFTTLCKNSVSAREALLRVNNVMAEKELRNCVRSTSRQDDIQSLTGEVTMQRMEQFHWNQVFSEPKDKLPLTVKSLDMLLPSSDRIRGGVMRGPDEESSAISNEDCITARGARLGIILAIILGSHAPQKYKFVPQLVGVQLWREGCTHTVFELLNFLGISQGVEAARRRIDALVEGHDSKIIDWKLALQASDSTADNSEVSCATTSSSSLSVDPTVTLDPDKAQLCNVTIPKRRLTFEPTHNRDIDRNIGYSLGWDNVQKSVKAKHITQEHGNEFLLMTQAFAVRHRTPSAQLDDQEVTAAVDIPPQSYLPSPQDWDEVRARMVSIVERMLVENVPALKELHHMLSSHNKHEHYNEMSSKSTIINIGAIKANPSTTAGVIEVMDQLHKYVPTPTETASKKVVCNGDQMSVERMTQSKRARVRGSTTAYRVQGLVETPQEFHKEGLMLQDTIDEFFEGKSVADRGTLFNWKEFFRHQSLRSKVMDNFQHVWDFLEFVTEGLVNILFLKLAEMDSLDDTPSSYSGTLKRKRLWLTRMARRIVDRVYNPTSAEDVEIVLESMRQHNESDDGVDEVYPFCSCKTEIEGEMVQCYNSHCRNSWYHTSCLDEEQAATVADPVWYCSDSCSMSPNFIFCHCRTKRGHEDDHMIQCSLGDECRRHQFYHPSCIGIAPRDLPATWFCSEQCELCESDDDKVLSHSRALLWRGLLHLSNRDAVREGDGPAILQFWRVYLPTLWNRNHYKYVIAAHRLLTNVNGFESERICHDLTWERVANHSGNPGANVGLDLSNEFLNNEFKELLSRSRGRYTDDQLNRCSKMCGSFGKEMNRLFRTCMGQELPRDPSTKKPQRYKHDLETFTREFKDDALFDYCPPREHTCFGQYQDKSHRIKSAVKLGRHLAKLSSEMDFWRRREQRARPPQEQTTDAV